MKLILDRDLCFFDIEATGLNVVRDRIVQIAIIKYFKDGREPQELSLMINPGIPISLEAILVHGIQPKDVANKPTFQQLAQKIWDFIGNADLAGYNSTRFDIPMLMEEFARVGMEFDVTKRRSIDVQRIFYKMEPRTLKAALKFYCEKDHEDAHDAMADVRATIDVFKGQLDKYEDVDYLDEDGIRVEAPIKNDVQVLHEFTNDNRFVDATQKLRADVNGDIVFNFGKYVGKPVGETLYEDRQYYNWILNKEFTSQVKQMVKKLVREYEKGIKAKEKENGNNE
ncbi:MAG: ribonuclease H-like domain-containing protein [Haliscomenobacter sp.]|nr:exonuclease domain-containing protein [Haliscomenobacter sp.]MBK9489516.1 ribonuclease H-like domain-containing protein [Haliscomenobacter sp.]